MLEKLKNHGLPLFILVLITILAMRNILFTDGYPGGGDLSATIFDATYLHTNPDYHFLWKPARLTGTFHPPSILNVMISWMLEFGSIETIAKLIWIFSFFGTGISMYVCLFYITRSKGIALPSSIVYMTIPPIVMNYNIGFLNYILGFALFPLTFLFVEKGIREKKISNYAILALLCSFLAFLGLDILFFQLPFLFAYSIISAAYRRDASFLLKFALVTIPLLIILTAFIWFPSVSMAIPRFVEFRGARWLHFSTLNLFNTFSLDIIEIWAVSALIIPILAFCALLKERSRFTVAFAFLALLSIFMVKGPNAPGGSVFMSLFENIELLQYVPPWKRLIMTTSFFYSGLIGFALFHFFREIRKKNSKSISIILVSSILVVGLLSGSHIILSGQGFRTWSPPSNEIAPHEWISQRDEEGRVVTVPYGTARMINREGFWVHDIGSRSYAFHGKPVISGPVRGQELSEPAKAFFRYTVQLANENQTTKLMKILGIFNAKYLVVQGYPWTMIDFALINKEYKLTYGQHSFFEKQDGIEKVWEGEKGNYVIKTPNWEVKTDRKPKVYVNNYCISRIFIPKNEMLVIGDLDAFEKLAEIENLNFGDWNLLFVRRQLEAGGKTELKKVLAERANVVTFVNTTPRHLAALLQESVEDIEKILENKEILFLIDKRTVASLLGFEISLVNLEVVVKELGGEVVLYSNGKPIGFSKDFPKLLEGTENAEILSIREISPIEWEVKVFSTGPYTLVFSSTYHPLWRAYVEDKEYTPTSSYYFINSYKINETGVHTVVFRFDGQKYSDIGLWISGSGYAGVLVFLIACLFRNWGKRYRLPKS
jgi:hypothetical protein